VKPSDFEQRLLERAAAADVRVDADALLKLYDYYERLAHWNVRINLTALPLDPLTPRSIDRLLVEPLAASRWLTDLPGDGWFDLGSGGGSPAIPLAIVRPELRLTLVEARERKAAFLREVVRTLGLSASVATVRFEDVAVRAKEQAALVTSRAVKTTSEFWEAVRRLLVPGGVAAVFGADELAHHPEGFDWLPRAELVADQNSHLLRGVRVPRGT